MSIVTPSKNKWWVLVATSTSLSMIFLDQSALPIALPSIQRELSLSAVSLQWVINAYILALAVFIMLGGKLGDKLGHRKIFQSGMIIFVIASILCAMAPTAMSLIISRALQGIGGALMIPASSPLFRTIVEPNEFGKMVGLYVSIASIFLILGPTLGGFLSVYLSWRWIFWINFPLALMAILITIFAMSADEKYAWREKGFDWGGFIFLSLSVIGLVFAFMEGQVLGWSSMIILGCLVVSVIAFIAFIITERRHPLPFIDFALFKDRCVSHCILIISLIQIAYMSIIFWAIFLQNTLLLSPARTGVYLLAAQVPVLVFSAVAGRMLDRFGPRLPISLGTAMIAFSTLWIAIFAWKHEFSWLFPALVLFGMGSPLTSIGIMSTVISSAPDEKRGIVSGIVSAARQIGGTIGLAILVALIVNITHHTMLQWIQHSGGSLSHLHVDQLNALLTGIPLPANLHLKKEEVSIAHAAAIHAYTLGFSCMMLVVTLFAFAGFLIARKLPNASSTQV